MTDDETAIRSLLTRLHDAWGAWRWRGLRTVLY